MFLNLSRFIWTFTVCLLTLHTKCSADLPANYSVFNFIKDIKQFYGFENLLIAKNRNATIARSFVGASSDGFSAELMDQVRMPMIQVNELASFYLKQRFNDLMLSIVYIDGQLDDHSGLLTRLVSNLRHMTFSKIIFLLNHSSPNEPMLRQLFEYCWYNKMINVVALLMDFKQTATFYGFTHFPEFQLEAKEISVDYDNRSDIYPYRLADLRKYKLTYIIGGSEPRIVVSLDKNGKMKIGGYAGHFLQAFAKKFNCVLHEPLPAKINAFAPAQELVAAVRNRTVDISAGLTFPSIPISGYTYPYEQMNWCLMAPVEPDVPNKEFYLIVFRVSALLLTIAAVVIISVVLSVALYFHGYTPDLLDFVVNDDCLRGALGQSFTEIVNPPMIVRFIYLQICVLGILLTTWYNSYFATYVTRAPKEPGYRTFDEILYSGKKVYAWTSEYNELVGRVKEFNKYTPMFHLESNYLTYIKVRDSFSTQYTYAVPSSKWIIVNEQQKVFTTPIFRWRENLCFFYNIPMSFPVHENSIFMQSLYQLMIETFQAGLMNYWSQMSFYELIESGKLNLTDLSSKHEFEAMKVEDLHYIWIGLGFMYILVAIVFLSEQIVFYRHKIKKFF